MDVGIPVTQSRLERPNPHRVNRNRAYGYVLRVQDRTELRATISPAYQAVGLGNRTGLDSGTGPDSGADYTVRGRSVGSGVRSGGDSNPAA